MQLNRTCNTHPNASESSASLAVPPEPSFVSCATGARLRVPAVPFTEDCPGLLHRTCVGGRARSLVQGPRSEVPRRYGATLRSDAPRSTDLAARRCPPSHSAKPNGLRAKGGILPRCNAAHRCTVRAPCTTATSGPALHSRDTANGGQGVRGPSPGLCRPSRVQQGKQNSRNDTPISQKMTDKSQKDVSWCLSLFLHHFSYE